MLLHACTSGMHDPVTLNLKEYTSIIKFAIVNNVIELIN